MRPRLGLSLVLSLGCCVFGASLEAAQLPGCRPTRPVILAVDDLIIPILHVDEVCGDPDATVDPRDDTDGDRLSDAWERVWFGSLTTASGAPGHLTTFHQDGLHLTDLEKWRFGLNPTVDSFVAGAVSAALTYDRRGQLLAVTFQGKTVQFTHDTYENIINITIHAP